MSRARSERRGFDKILFDQHVLRVRTMKGATDCGPPRAHPLGNKAELDKVWGWIGIFDPLMMKIQDIPGVMMILFNGNDVGRLDSIPPFLLLLLLLHASHRLYHSHFPLS